MNTKEPIRLRRRLLASGSTSLYLDVYINGRRSYEYLHLYLTPERTRGDKERNRQTVMLAEAIRAKRIVELRNGVYGFRNSKQGLDTPFFTYFERLCGQRYGSEGNWGNWRSALKHLRKYERRRSITFAEVDADWVSGFRDYLLTRAVSHRYGGKLSRNSAVSYFRKLRACLNQAYEDGIIPSNPIRGVAGIKDEDGTRMYLTIEEVRRLSATPCKHEGVKRAFLFSCLTGLRKSDIERLTWGEVYEQGGRKRIIFKQQKTGGLEYLDITAQAAALMGERGADGDCVFTGIMTTSATNNAVRVWVANAGIGKDITFHCARHTFATMMLDLGTDIYTVSKLLGHRDLSTTQIYAKVLDKAKQAAVDSIPQIIGEE